MSTNKPSEQLIAEALEASRSGSSEFDGLLDQAALQLGIEDWKRLDMHLAQERPGWHTLQVSEALDLLEGHGILTVAGAIRVCRALGATFEKRLILRWKSPQDACKRFGIFDVSEGAGCGVSALTLSYAICEQFGLGQPGYRYSGKGFQSQANRKAIADHLQPPPSTTEV